MQALSQLSYSPTGPSREYYNSFGKGVNWGGYAPGSPVLFPPHL